MVASPDLSFCRCLWLELFWLGNTQGTMCGSISAQLHCYIYIQGQWVVEQTEGSFLKGTDCHALYAHRL
eukprot:scaffold18755_cov20-Tisochrysis_lutea.AAC.1